MGGRGIRGMKTRVEWECCIGRVGQIEQWRHTKWRSPRRKSQCFQKKQEDSR